jgi:hypothetical protein
MTDTPPRLRYADVVRPFDHVRLAALPEYAPAVAALNELIHAINREDVPDVDLARRLDIVRDMAVSLPFHVCSGVPGRRAAGVRP